MNLPFIAGMLGPYDATVRAFLQHLCNSFRTLPSMIQRPFAALPNRELVGVRAARQLAHCLDTVVAVVRPQDPPRAAALRGAGCRIIECTESQHGMARSLACAVTATSQADGWVIALADMPAIRRETILRVITVLEAGNSAQIVAPAYHGQRGHPVGFGNDYRMALQALDGDHGARSLIEQHRNQMQLLETEDWGVLTDIDSRSDLQQFSVLCKRL